jgi:uncharacterized protein with HEPN domain
VSRTDGELIVEALYHLEILHNHLSQGTLDDPTIADAVCLRLAAAIEVVAKTSAEFREQSFGDEWPAMWATRNRIAHDYGFIDIGRIGGTLNDQLPHFEAVLREHVEEKRAREHPDL